MSTNVPCSQTRVLLIDDDPFIAVSLREYPSKVSRAAPLGAAKVSLPRSHSPAAPPGRPVQRIADMKRTLVALLLAVFAITSFGVADAKTQKRKATKPPET